MAFVEIDCTQARLASGIRVAACRRFAGLCVEASRRIDARELVHRYPLQLVAHDAQVRLLTELGVRECNLSDHCVEITEESLDGLDPEILEHLALRTGAHVADRKEIYRRLTDDGERRFVLAFDDLINHSSAANLEFVLAVGVSEAERSQGFAWGELYASRAIESGEELTLNYRTFYGADWEPPAEWMA